MKPLFQSESLASLNVRSISVSNGKSEQREAEDTVTSAEVYRSDCNACITRIATQVRTYVRTVDGLLREYIMLSYERANRLQTCSASKVTKNAPWRHGMWQCMILAKSATPLALTLPGYSGESLTLTGYNRASLTPTRSRKASIQWNTSSRKTLSVWTNRFHPLDISAWRPPNFLINAKQSHEQTAYQCCDGKSRER